LGEEDLKRPRISKELAIRKKEKTWHRIGTGGKNKAWNPRIN